MKVPETSILKKQLRSEILNQRNSLSSKEVSIRSQTVIEKFLNDSKILEKKEYKNKTSFFGLYKAYKNELSLDVLENVLYEKGYQLAYPKMEAHDEMNFYHVENPFSENSWKKNLIGIDEPCSSMIPISDENINCLIVPSVVCDIQGNRIGMGKGYYDRYLKKNKKVKKIALLYDFQIVQNILPEKHDIQVDWLFGETNSLFLKR